MVFGRSKERRVPDLSRYDYHYKDRDDFNRSSGLSTAAAYAASKGAYSPAVQRSQPQRSYSMTHYAGATGKQHQPAQRTPKSASGNYRSYSLRSQGSGQPARSNQNGSRANSITVKTTEVRDPTGRTQSITRRTIKRANGYEYVETTTTTTQAIPIIDAEKHFDEFSGNYTMQDDGIEELSEEEPVEQPSGHAYAALLSQGADGEVPLDQTSSISQFSDALDYMPNKRRTAKVKRRPTDTHKNVQRKPSQQQQRQQHQQQQQQPKRQLTEKEMYEKAYAVAQQSVYNEPSRTASQGRQSRMGQRTLRGPTPGSEPSVAGSKPRSSKISSFFQKNHTEVPKSAPPAMEEKPANPPPQPLGSKQRESDEDMYAQALAIAQQKYGQTSETVESPKPPTSSVSNIQEPVPRSNSDIDVQVSEVFERQEATTVTKTTTPDAEVNDSRNEWDRYDAAHPEPVAKTASHERKSKFKNMFEKVKQFSAENSGYQPPKKTQAPSAPAESVTDDINIVSVAPLNRAGSTSSHGASTTRNVEASLDQVPKNQVPKEKKPKNGFFKKLFKRS